MSRRLRDPQSLEGIISSPIRDWSLITGSGGGTTKREWGAREVLPLQKGGGGSFSHAEGGGGHNKIYGSFYRLA